VFKSLVLVSPPKRIGQIGMIH
jgi:hypothetical protein